eukprot:Em0007g83a
MKMHRLADTENRSSPQAIYDSSIGADVEMKIAAFCDVVMATAAGPAPHMACKVLYQLREVSSRCELEGIHSVGGLRPAAIVLKRTLAVLQGMSLGTEDTLESEAMFGGCCGDGVRLHSLSLSSQEVPVFAALVEGVVQAIVGRLRENPEADVPSCLEDLPLFVTSVLGQTCKSKPSTDLFASHLCEYLSQHTLQPPPHHQASLHILMAISKCGSGEDC